MDRPLDVETIHDTMMEYQMRHLFHLQEPSADLSSVSDSTKNMLSMLKVSLVGTFIYEENDDYTRYLTKEDLSTICKKLTIGVQHSKVNSNTAVVVLGKTDRKSSKNIRIPFKVMF